MLDFDLAVLYQVDTKMLKRAVRRNLKRFPQDFMFELTAEEFRNLRYQFGTLKNTCMAVKYNRKIKICVHWINAYILNAFTFPHLH